MPGLSVTGTASILSSHLAPICEKLFESLICKRVLDELLDHFEGHCRHIGADARRFDDVDGMANAGRERFPPQTAIWSPRVEALPATISMRLRLAKRRGRKSV